MFFEKYKGSIVLFSGFYLRTILNSKMSCALRVVTCLAKSQENFFDGKKFLFLVHGRLVV